MSAAARRLMRTRCYVLDSARRDLANAVAAHGADHPAARAALGRLWFHLGRVPQAGLVTIEGIAWARESGGNLRPRWNRSQRRHLSSTRDTGVDGYVMNNERAA
jgi:hypothetical protein